MRRIKVGSCVTLLIWTAAMPVEAQSPWTSWFGRLALGWSTQSGSTDYRRSGPTIGGTAGYSIAPRIGLRLDVTYQHFAARRVADPSCILVCPTVPLATDDARHITLGAGAEWRVHRHGRGLYAVTGVSISRRSGVQLQEPGWVAGGVGGVGMRLGLVGLEARFHRYIGVPRSEAWTVPIVLTFNP